MVNDHRDSRGRWSREDGFRGGRIRRRHAVTGPDGVPLAAAAAQPGKRRTLLGNAPGLLRGRLRGQHHPRARGWRRRVPRRTDPSPWRLAAPEGGRCVGGVRPRDRRGRVSPAWRARSALAQAEVAAPGRSRAPCVGGDARRQTAIPSPHLADRRPAPGGHRPQDGRHAGHGRRVFVGDLGCSISRD